MKKLRGFGHIAVGVVTLLALSPAVFASTATFDFATDGPGVTCADGRVPPMFNRPSYGTQTAAFIRTPVGCDSAGDYLFGNDALLQGYPGLSSTPPYSEEVRWSWVNPADNNTWLRLLTYTAQSVAPYYQAPIMYFGPGASVSMNIMVWGRKADWTENTFGALEFGLIVRETGENLPLGTKGATTGTYLEILGIDSTGGAGSPANATTPVGGVSLQDSVNFYHVEWVIVDSTHVDVYVDDPYRTNPIHKSVVGFSGSGDSILSASPANRGTIDGLAIRKPVADTESVTWYIDVDDIIINAPGVIDPVVVQGPLSQLRSKVTITNIDPTATQVALYANGTQIAFATSPAADFSSGAYQFTGLSLAAGQSISATQTVGGVESAQSSGVTVTSFESIDDFQKGVTWTRAVPSTGGAFRQWYEVNSVCYTDGAAGTLDGSASFHYSDSGFMNGVYAIYDHVVPSTKTNYVVTAKIHIQEGADKTALRAYELGAQPNGIHRNVTSAATPGSNTTACHNQSLLAIDTTLGAYGSFAGLDNGDNTGTQTVMTGAFSAAENDNLLIAFSSNVHTKWADAALDSSGQLDSLDPCESASGFPPTRHPVRNAQGTWNVLANKTNTYVNSGGGGPGWDVDDIRLDLWVPCAAVTPVSIGSIVNINQTCVTVIDVTAGATAINVYSNVNTLIGTLTSGIVAGTNTVTLTRPLVNGEKISATQVVNNQEGCTDKASQKTVGTCGQVGKLSLTGPLNAGATSVTVNNVDTAATLVQVYQGTTLIGSLSSGIVAGDNVVPVTALVKGWVLQAQQTVPVGCGGDPLKSCAGFSQTVGSGHNSSIRLSLGVREVTGLTGPVGVDGYNPNNEPIEWIIPIDAGDAASGQKTGGAPIGHKVLTSPDWQTVTFDPNAGASNVVSFNLGNGVLNNAWVTIEHLAITMDQDAKDVGPYKMYIDNVYNGTTLVQDFNTTTGGVMFKTPGAAGSTGQFLMATPSVATTDAAVYDGTSGRSDRIEWRWDAEGDASTYRWVRLTTDNTSSAPYPGGSPEIQTNVATTMRIFLPCPGPTITGQPSPATQNLLAGASVTYSVTATSSNTMSYQWYKGTTALADGGSISGATTPSLTINPVAAADAGDYTVKVTDVCGTTTSSKATLGICVPVAITGQPANQNPAAGGTATFTVTATGSGTLAYQWRKGGTNLVDGGNIAGAQTATLTISNVAAGDAGSYDCVVSNGCAADATSAAANLQLQVSSVNITAWRSLKTHSGVGEVGITLNAASTATGQTAGVKVEARNSSAQAGITKIEVDFDAAVTVVDPSKVTVTGAKTTGCSASGGGCVMGTVSAYTPSSVTMKNAQTMTIAFTNNTVTGDGCYIISIADGAVSANINGDRDCKIRMLQSDSTGDGLVNVNDMSQIKSRLSQAITSTNCNSDQNLAAGINVVDMSQTKSRLGRRALCP